MKCFGFCVLLSIAGFLTVQYVLFTIYQPIPTGKSEIYLSHASGSSTIIKEAKYGISHIYADTMEMTIYTQGYLHAQERLWAMERLRRFAKGTLSEIFSAETIEVDKLSLSLGLHRAAKDTWESKETMSQDQREYFLTYAQGVNDYIQDSSKYLPPEFYVFGLTPANIDPWHPIDTICVIRALNFFMSFSWHQDLLRDIITNLENENGEVGDLKDIAEEMVPFSAEFAHNLHTTMDEKQMKDIGLYSDKTLLERYKEGQKKFPKNDTQKFKNKSKKEKVDTVKKQVIDPLIGLGDQMGSNNWVISGKHTKSGMPLLASDPHLKNSIPSMWHIQHLQYESDGENITLAGATLPGLPFVVFGRSDYLQWGLTASHSDVVDLYQEKVSDDGKSYFLDGSWREFPKTLSHTIKVMGQSDVDFDLKFTHRGPVLESSILRNTQELFSNRQPLEDTSSVFSFVWGSAGAGESTVALLDSVTYCKNLFEFHDSLRTKAGESWISLGINIVASDIEGNIGYWMLSASPIRRNDYPYLGSSVLDGTSSVHDWEGIAKIKDMPYYINPESGYFHTSNSRNVPEHSKFEYGAGVTNSIRNLRIEEILSQGIAKGHKFDLQEMIEMQNDVVDIMAREMTPHIIKIVERSDLSDFNPSERQKITETIKILKNFKGSMSMDSNEASIYAVFQYFFFRGLLHNYTTGSKSHGAFWHSPEIRIGLFATDAFGDFYQRLILDISQEQGYFTKWDHKICGGKPYADLGEQKGSGCQYNLIRSVLEANRFLEKKFGKDPETWKWGRMHPSDYEFAPWSMTPLKPFWHREVPIGGNCFTIGIGRYEIQHTEVRNEIKAQYTANYKQVGELTHDKKVMFASIDTGQNGNLFAEHYFDQNEPHHNGNVPEIITDIDQLLSDSSSRILHIHPLSSRSEHTSDL